MFLNVFTPKNNMRTVENVLDIQYMKLQEEFFNKKPEFTINGYPIIIDLTHKSQLYRTSNPTILTKPYFNIFIHLCTAENYFSNNIECKNSLPYNLCNTPMSIGNTNKCENSTYSIVLNNKIRHTCLQRACRVHWIPKILDAYNEEGNVFFREYQNSVYIIYKYAQSSMYVIIFSKDRNFYKFKTAYPVTTGQKKFFNQLI